MRLFAWITALAAAAPLCAGAQSPRAEVVISGDAVTGDALAIMQSAFSHVGVTLVRAPVPADCSGMLERADLTARAWISWEPSQQAQLCFQTHCHSARRTLGPFSTLDAHAREELITVVESALSAMAMNCEASPSPEAPVAAAPPDPQPGSERAATHGAREETQSSAQAQPALPRATTEHSDANVEPRVATASVVPTKQSEPVVSRRERTDSSASVVLGASYGLTRWTQRVFTQIISGLAAYPLQPRVWYTAVEVGYVPAFRVRQDELMIEGTSVRLAWLLWGRLALARSFSLEGQIGPALEWLWLAPNRATASVLIAPRSTSHADPRMVARLGPSLQLYSNLWLGLDLCLDASWKQRSFGFASTLGPVHVLTPDPLRWSITLHARAAL